MLSRLRALLYAYLERNAVNLDNLTDDELRELITALTRLNQHNQAMQPPALIREWLLNRRKMLIRELQRREETQQSPFMKFINTLDLDDLEGDDHADDDREKT